MSFYYSSCNVDTPANSSWSSQQIGIRPATRLGLRSPLDLYNPNCLARHLLRAECSSYKEQLPSSPGQPPPQNSFHSSRSEDEKRFTASIARELLINCSPLRNELALDQEGTQIQQVLGPIILLFSS